LDEKTRLSSRGLSCKERILAHIVDRNYFVDERLRPNIGAHSTAALWVLVQGLAIGTMAQMT
jgi:hypothetical protein